MSKKKSVRTEEKEEEKKKIYICAPQGGADKEEIKKNTEWINKIKAAAVDANKEPVNPHFAFSDIFFGSTEEEHAQYLAISEMMMKDCVKVWVSWTGKYTDEMMAELQLAIKIGKDIHFHHRPHIVIAAENESAEELTAHSQKG